MPAYRVFMMCSREDGEWSLRYTSPSHPHLLSEAVVSISEAETLPAIPVGASCAGEDGQIQPRGFTLTVRKVCDPHQVWAQFGRVVVNLFASGGTLSARCFSPCTVATHGWEKMCSRKSGCAFCFMPHAQGPTFSGTGRYFFLTQGGSSCGPGS